ncbi:hypothetical protein [uncultured Algibacter sp.]|uniref:hypothetical protein n=1 Tax=uncultured Algibacter sp. TaxID=298659 RepID=UPI0030EE3858|tara:strand:- start:166 stop:645 length:480 start_codon:yes stop_codon:yes gene_type:complete
MKNLLLLLTVSLLISCSKEDETAMDVQDAFSSVTVQFQTYFDFETQMSFTDPDFDIDPNPNYDLTFAYNNSGSFMFWNEGFSSMAFVYDKSFTDLSFPNVSNYYFCEQFDDDNPACIDFPALPINFVALFKTNDGNYYAVEYISEDRDEGVTFRYKLLN